MFDARPNPVALAPTVIGEMLLMPVEKSQGRERVRVERVRVERESVQRESQGRESQGRERESG